MIHTRVTQFTGHWCSSLVTSGTIRSRVTSAIWIITAAHSAEFWTNYLHRTEQNWKGLTCCIVSVHHWSFLWFKVSSCQTCHHTNKPPSCLSDQTQVPGLQTVTNINTGQSDRRQARLCLIGGNQRQAENYSCSLASSDRGQLIVMKTNKKMR